MNNRLDADANATDDPFVTRRLTINRINSNQPGRVELD
jgi:hypothetical protein